MKQPPNDLPKVNIYFANQSWSQPASFNPNNQNQYSFSFPLNPKPDGGLAHNHSKPPTNIAPPDNAQIANSQSIQTPTNLDNQHSEANSKPPAQYLPVILQFFKFLEQQLANPLPVVLGGAFGLVVLAMLLGQMWGGIRVKLDLEVSPSPNQIEKTAEAK
ncbi:MAG TPA: hypothetical protein DCY88_34125 [Cyanobacteria bacterium UBA11372]|nr:hypothetical protein [Cyanobacteria bacterium UBA11372]